MTKTDAIVNLRKRLEESESLLAKTGCYDGIANLECR